MMPSVQRGDVFWLELPGDNGETKRRPCVVVDLAPPGQPAVAILIFGCSTTKPRTDPRAVVRIEESQRATFRALGLSNATSFHREDIRCYDASSPMLAPNKRAGRCPPATMTELRELLAQRYLDRAPIPLLPKQASDAARGAAAALTRGGAPTESGPDEP
jgi:mRNA-degrading endonuclease toxin of MazEF toxin-antitoxin module